MSLQLRQKLVEIARVNVGRVESSRNQAPWIKPLWFSTSYGLEGYENREPYCAAGMCWALDQWTKIAAVRSAMGMTPVEIEGWRCKSAAVSGWYKWAVENKIQILPPSANMHTGDFIIYRYSHIEMFVDDSGPSSKTFTAIGYNTNAAGSRDGEGCAEKSRDRALVKYIIRVMD
ncbi:MAG: hypothetical protein WBC06_09180 [Chitinophagaceae bacterium]